MRLTATALTLICSALAAQYDPFAEARQAEVNGARLAYVERGTGGTPVILVHGSGADLRTWGYQLQHFGQTRRTIAYSRRFHHPNAPPAAGDVYAAGQQSDDLAAFIGSVASGRADIVASSYGAVIALMAARNHPGRVRRLVLVEPVAFSMLTPGSAEASASDRARRRAAPTARGRERAGDADVSIGVDWAGRLRPDARVHARHAARQPARADGRGACAAVTTSPRYTCQDVARVTAPTLLIDGGASAPFLRAMTRAVGACLPHVDMRTIPGASHAVHAQQVQAFNQMAQEFLDRP